MDPISFLGLLSTAGAIAATITATIKQLSDLRSQLKDADVRIRLLIGELSAVKSALSQINDWRHYLDDTHRQADVMEGLEISLEGVQLAMDALAEEVRLLMGGTTPDASLAHDFRLRIRYAWSESSLTQHENRLRAQIAALHLLLQAVQCQSTLEEKEFLQAATSRQIIQKVADDTSTLRATMRGTASQGTPTIVSHDDSTIDSKIFEWDDEIVNADIYRRAMRHAQSKAEMVTKPVTEGEERLEVISQAGTEESSDRLSFMHSPVVSQRRKPLPYETSIVSEPLFGQQTRVVIPDSSLSERPASRRSILAYRQKTPVTEKKSFWSSISRKSSSRGLAPPERNPTPQSMGNKSQSLGSRRGRRGFESNYHISIDFGSEDGLSAPAIVRAAQAGSVIEVETLLDQRADINARHMHSGRSALSVAAHCGNEDVVRLLLQYGAAVNERDASQLTPLHLASSRGHVGAVELLLQERADVDVKGPDEQTPLRIACEKGEVEVAEALLRKRAKANARDIKQLTPLHIAAKQGDEALTEILLANGAHLEAKDGAFMGPLHYACEGGHVGVVETLLKNKADLEALGKNSMTPLLCASSSGQVQVVELLLRRKASLRHKGDGEMTALHWASFNGHVEVVDVLLQKRASLVAPNKEGRTPLHLAILADEFAVADLLLRKGAPTEAQCRSLRRPIHYACIHGNAEMAQLLLGYSANVEAEDGDHNRALHYVCTRGSQPHVELLLQKGVSIDARNSNGDRPLCLASKVGHLEIIKILLDRGAAPRAKFSSGPSHEDSPLCLSARYGRAPVVQELLRRGASALQKDERDWQPLRYAAFHAHPEVVEILLQHGATVSGGSSGGWGFNITAQRIGFAEDVKNEEQRKGHVLRLLTSAEAKEQRSRENTVSSVPYVSPAIQSQTSPAELPNPGIFTSSPGLPKPPSRPPPSATQEMNAEPVKSPRANRPSVSSPSSAIPPADPPTVRPQAPQNLQPPNNPMGPRFSPNVIPNATAQPYPALTAQDQNPYYQAYPAYAQLPPQWVMTPQPSAQGPYAFMPNAIPQPMTLNQYPPNAYSPSYASMQSYVPSTNPPAGTTMTMGSDGVWQHNATPSVQRVPSQRKTQNDTVLANYPAGAYELAS